MYFMAACKVSAANCGSAKLLKEYMKFQSLQVKGSNIGGEKLLDPLSFHCWYLSGFEQKKTNRTGHSHFVAQMEEDLGFLLV